ncbi:ATP-grasp domain-containing protein [Kitasatospora sp. NBC_01250]|uniref:ATP-grasp domain-containing protein n=1 Tax=unclassified Kitasatospora TaxID=2633591 RepID=UPI002E14DE7B|nr:MULTISPECIES: ATP-grasp domain-containing protein [unclassified Kitasatospora]WSJ71244.1 ATP-grasp domain-containing protein [Kitasatospora sp. NBC_01302]
MPEHVLVMGTGREYPALVRAASPGADTTVLCRVEYVHKLRLAHENARVVAVREQAPDEEWIALAAAVHAYHPFTRIATVGERDQDRCAAVGAALGLPTHRPETVAMVHDKNLMRNRLDEAGVDTTAHTLATSEQDVRAFLRAHGGPVVVKPVAGAGSAGVALVHSEEEVAAAWQRATGDDAWIGSTESGVVVEEFLSGEQYSVEAFSEAGEHLVVSITRKYSDPVSFVELGHVAPAPLTEVAAKEVEGYVTRVLDALGVEFGATHTEVVLGPDGPRVIETHLRAGGDEIPELTLDVTGVDLADCVVRQTLGESVLPGIRATLAEPREPIASAIWFAALDGAGVLAEVSGSEAAEAVAGVSEVQLLARPGAVIAGLASSESRVAQVRATAATADAAVAAAQEGVGRLEFLLQSHARKSETV